MEAKAPPGGTRIRGAWYDAGDNLPPDVQRIVLKQQDAAQLGSLLGVNMRQSFTTLDDEMIEGMPPGGGHFPIPHVWTFQGLVSSLAKVYRSPDEAIKHNIDNSRFMRNDLAIMECLEQRQRSGSLLDWHLEVEGDEKGEYKDFLDDFTKVIAATPDFTKWRHVLLEALWYGRYAIQHEYTWKWIDGERRLVVKDWRPVNGDKLVFRYDDGTMQYAPDQMGVRVMTGWNVKPGDRVPAYAYNRDHSPKQFQIEQIGGLQLSDRGMAYFLDADTRKRFVVHRHIIEDAAYESPIDAGSIYGLGIRSRLYWTWFQKQETLSYLMEYIERSALGVEVWFYPYGNKQAEIRTRQAAQDRIGNGRNIILVPKMMGESGDLFGYERIDPAATGAEQLKDIVTDYFGHQIKRYVLGQTLTSEAAATGLGSGVADIHLDTYLQIIKFDALNLEESVTRDFIRHMQDWNYGHNTTLKNLNVRFVIETEANDAKDKMSAWKEAYEMGLKIRARDVYELIGAAVPTATDEVLEDPQHKQADMQLNQMNPLGAAAGAPAGANGSTPTDGNLMQHAELSTNMDHQRLGHHLGVDMSAGPGDGRSRFSRVEGLKKKALGSYGHYSAYVVDGEAVRNASPDAQEFGGMATECLLPDVVPDGEIWIEDDVHPDEIPLLVSNGLAQYKAVERGASDDDAYKAGLAHERKLRAERYGAANKAHWARPGEHDDVYVGKSMRLDDDVDVRLVDGEKVRDYYKTDFIEGGHGYVYPFIPNTEIWLEAGMHPDEYPVVLLHEAAELKAMRDHGMKYHEAHDMASQVEFAERKRRGMTPEKYALGAVAQWDPSKHPRGQPENVGEFGPGGGGKQPTGMFGQPHTPGPGHRGHTPTAPKGGQRRPDIPAVESPYKHPEIAAFLAGPVASGAGRAMTAADAENKWAPLKTVGPNGDGIEYPPGDKILPREHMPQIDGHDDIASFLGWLGQRGVDSVQQTVAVGTLLPTQKDIQVGGKVKGMLVAIDSGAIYKDRLKWPPILISKDGYIIDGHHRWRALAQLSPNELINAVRINAPIDQLVGNAAAPDGLTMEFLNSGLVKSPKSGYFDIKSKEVHTERTQRAAPEKAERQPMVKPVRQWQPEDPYWNPMDDADDNWVARSIQAWENGEYNVGAYTPEKFERRQAPKGGVTMQGKFYPGGEFIPGEVLKSATPEELQALDEPEEIKKLTQQTPTGTTIARSPLGAYSRDEMERTVQRQLEGKKPENLTKIAKVVDDAIKSVEFRGASKAAAQFYRETFNRVLGRMNGTCVSRIAGLMSLAVFYKTLKELQHDMMSFNSGGTMGYCERGSAGHITIALDGGTDTGESLGRGTLDAEEIYAHELSHVIDNMGGTSMNSDWIAASNEEIKDSRQLSNYARTSPLEAWAEFGRLVWTNPKIAKTFFPKCWNVWYNDGLVDQPAVGKTQAEAIQWDPHSSYAPTPPSSTIPSLDQSGPFKIDAITEARFDNEGAFTTMGNKSTTRIYYDVKGSDKKDAWYRLKGKERVYLTPDEYFKMQDTMGTTELVSVRSLAGRFYIGAKHGNPPGTV